LIDHLIIINLAQIDSRSNPQVPKPEPAKSEPAKQATPAPTTAQPTLPKAAEPKPVQPVILDPANPQLDLDNSTQLSPWKFGAKRILSSVNSVCQRLNNLILKVVAKVFPWNRRAKRRLAAKAGSDPEAVDDEL
jgi:hypothetical protein